MKLSGFVSVDYRVARSVSLERDAGSLEVLERFQVTPLVCRLVERFASALNGEPVWAWSLTGPYGTGKSAFCNYLLALCSCDEAISKAARVKLKGASEKTSALFEKGVRDIPESGLFAVRGTSRYESLNHTLLRSLESALAGVRGRGRQVHVLEELRSDITALQKNTWPDNAQVFDAFMFAHKVVKSRIVLVVDEFGKNLEYMTHHSGQGDIFMLQALAECGFCYVFVCLHQSFSAYAGALSSVQREEWQKVQGRFEDVSYIEPASRTVDLIAEALTIDSNSSKGLKGALSIWGGAQASAMKRLNLHSLGVRWNTKKCIRVYPFHPLAASLIGELCRRFAQNDRTVFSFLSSGDMHALLAFLEGNDWALSEESLPSLGLDILYDYFCEITSLQYGNRTAAQRWIEIKALIDSQHSCDDLDLKLLKTIGVLNILSGIPGITASGDVIRVLLTASGETSQKEVDARLAKLMQDRVLIYRKYADEYRLWEGSDYDLEGAIREERAGCAIQHLDAILNRVAERHPVIASAHSYKTGTVRVFESTWALAEHGNDIDVGKDSDVDGVILYVPGRGHHCPTALRQLTEKRNSVIVCYTPMYDSLKELALDAAAAVAVYQSDPGLTHDAAARREARFRADAAQEAFRKYTQELFSPGGGQVQWYALGELQHIHTGRDVSRLVSTVCDSVYKHCPYVNNEMINVNHLSSAGAKAQRELAEAMVEHATKEQVGLEGFGPEVALYRTLIKQKNLHEEKKGKWRFSKPIKGEGDKGLVWLWEKWNRCIASAASVDVASLIDIARRAPCGMRYGAIPIFVTHYLLVHQDELALYESGQYKPYFGGAEITLLIKRPEYFSVRRIVSTGVRRAVVQAYMNVLNTEVLELDQRVHNPTLLKIASPLIQFMESLPEYTRFTRDIMLNAQKLRTVVLNAREPVDLLFEAVPKALGIDAMSDGGNASGTWKTLLRKELQEALIELSNAYERLNLKIQDALMKAFRWEQSEKRTLAKFRKHLQQEVEPLLARCGDKDLKPVLLSMLNSRVTDEEWVRGIAGRIVKKPTERWRDTDFEPYHAAVYDTADRIRGLKELVAHQVGISNKNSRVVSVTTPDGKTKRRLVTRHAKLEKTLREQYADLLKADPALQETLYVMLSEKLHGDLADE